MMMMMMTMTQQQQQQQQLSEMVLMAVGSEVSVYEWAVMVAGIFMIFSLALSTFLLFDHLSTYNDPEVMKQTKPQARSCFISLSPFATLFVLWLLVRVFSTCWGGDQKKSHRKCVCKFVCFFGAITGAKVVNWSHFHGAGLRCDFGMSLQPCLQQNSERSRSAARGLKKEFDQLLLSIIISAIMLDSFSIFNLLLSNTGNWQRAQQDLG